jgi:flagellar biosynthesis/type III secretory pathway chaperone
MTTLHHDPVACAEALLAILRREHAALLASEAETIEQIAAEKRHAVATIESLSRELTLESEALPATTRQRFLTLTAECRRQNDINGSMVAASLRHLQQFIALVHGHNPQTSVYQRAGQSQTDFGSRPLAKV